MAIPKPVRATPKFPTNAATENIIVGEYMLTYVGCGMQGIENG